MVHANVRGRTLSVNWSDKVTTGSVGFKIVFHFDSEWDDLNKIVIFQGSNRNIAVIPENNICIIPYEVLVTPGGKLRVGVYGMNGEGDIVIPTIWNEDALIYAGTTLTEDIGTTPTPTAIATLTSNVNALQTRVPDCPTSSNGWFVLMAHVLNGTVTYSWEPV